VLVADQRKVRKGDVLVALDAEPYRVEMAQALAQMQQARATLDTLDTLSGTAAEKRAARSALASAKRAHAFAKRSSGRTVIRAPHAGTVFLLPSATGQASPRIERGQGVSPQAPLLRLVDLDQLKFVADLDQRDVSLVANGQLARCSLDSSAALTYQGVVTHVSLVSKTTASGVTAFTAESSLPSDARRPRPGTEGTVEITVGGDQSVVAVPQAAVTRRNRQPVVFVVADDVAHAKPVSLTSSRGDEYLVNSGLKVGDVVATSGVDELRDGARVVVK
jgi:RND family efflux transporter MFP subunit